MRNDLRTENAGFSAVPKRGAVALVTTTIAVFLLFGFKTGDPVTLGGANSPAAIVGDPNPTRQPGGVAVVITPPPTQRSTGGGVPVATPVAPTNPPAGNSASSGTFTGSVSQTPFGNVQVAIVMRGGKIVDVQELQLPNDRRLSQQISAYAGPILKSQTLSAQSANINGVSGASYTSQGFYDSLQSALAQVH